MNDQANHRSTRHQRLRPTALLSAVLTALTCALLSGHAQSASAQTPQWTSTGPANSNLYNTDGGSVGIGTTTPSTGKIHIAAPNSGGSYPLIKLQNTQTGGHTYWLYSGALGIPGDFGIYDDTIGTYNFYIKDTGNVGIGTTSPEAKLHAMSTSEPLRIGYNSTNYASFVVGSTGNLSITPSSGYTFISGLRFNPTDALVNQIYQSNLNKTLGLTANGGDISFGQTSTQQLIIKPSGTVGINKTNPNSAYKLDVDGTINATEIYKNGAPISGSQWATGTGNISFSSGNVGIGTTTPTKALDVAGDINASGTITGGNIVAKYQDVAEWVPSSRAIPAATVVVLDASQSNQVLPSNKAYDTRVAGVISAQPGIALGEKGAGKVLVATTGRVKVKVDATREPIQVGDLLVTSEVEGVAMKSAPLDLGGVPIHRPGTLIGKALEPLEKGTGEILVLLSLQ